MYSGEELWLFFFLWGKNLFSCVTRFLPKHIISPFQFWVLSFVVNINFNNDMYRSWIVFSLETQRCSGASFADWVVGTSFDCGGQRVVELCALKKYETQNMGNNRGGPGRNNRVLWQLPDPKPGDGYEKQWGQEKHFCLIFTAGPLKHCLGDSERFASATVNTLIEWVVEQIINKAAYLDNNVSLLLYSAKALLFPFLCVCV